MIRGPLPGRRPPAAKILRCGEARESVRRLTKEELRATLADLLPSLAAQVEVDLESLPGEGSMLDGFSPFYSEAQVVQWVSLADKVGGLVAASASARAALGSDPCLGSATVTAGCWQAALRPFLRSAFRRPATDAEVERYVGYTSGKDAPAAAQAVVSRILLAPDFLFRIESGTAGKDPARVRLSDHEVASRLSYGMAGSMPDAVLAAAADRGELQTLAQIEQHARRLLDTPRAKQKIQRFFSEWMAVESFSNPNPGVFAWAALPGTAAETSKLLQQDVNEFVENVVFKEQGSFRDLTSKRASYTANATLHALYGASAAATPGDAYETPHHAGLAFRVGALASSGLGTNPIVRGKNFLQRFMCVEFPEPDPADLARAQAKLTTLDPRTTPNYERVNTATAEAGCKGCHEGMGINQTGFLMESYDQVGRWRTQETYLEDVKGKVTPSATHPLPGAVTDLNIGPGLPTMFAGPLELVDAVSKSEAARECASKFVLRNLEQRALADADRCLLGEAAAGLAAGGPVLDVFVKSVANEDIFWRKL